MRKKRTDGGQRKSGRKFYEQINLTEVFGSKRIFLRQRLKDRGGVPATCQVALCKSFGGLWGEVGNSGKFWEIQDHIGSCGC